MSVTQVDMYMYIYGKITVIGSDMFNSRFNSHMLSCLLPSFKSRRGKIKVGLCDQRYNANGESLVPVTQSIRTGGFHHVKKRSALLWKIPYHLSQKQIIARWWFQYIFHFQPYLGK